MSVIQPPAQGQKRKSDVDVPNAQKRPSLDAFTERSNNGDIAEQYWMVQWRAPQTKKHKTWDGDAVLVLRGHKCTLCDADGKLIATGSISDPLKVLEEGQEFVVGSKEVGMDRPITRREYFSGSCFGRFSSMSSTPTPRSGAAKQFEPPKHLHRVPSTASGTPQRNLLPLQPVNLYSEPAPNTGDSGVQDSHWTANWRKPQGKKNKTWDGDAFVSHTGNKITMISEEGKILGITTWKGDLLCGGYSIRIGGKEVELESRVPASDLPIVCGLAVELNDNSATENYPVSPPPVLRASADMAQNLTVPTTPLRPRFVPPTSFYGTVTKLKVQGSLHDPTAEDAVIMKAPTEEHQAKFNKKNRTVVPVVLDPILARYMRPHQQEGVRFLYECVMGLRKHEGQGCILADEMGLGKTLQTIGLIWTLLKQNPYAGIGPMIGKALIVCPVSLITNWKSEFHKWLGRDRVGVFTGDKDKTAIKQFVNSKIHQVLIIGYERLRTVVDDLAYCQPPIGLIVCDEGHRLKSANNKTTAAFKALRTHRRVILSGTPIQNELSEFHAMADFCNPGLLDDYAIFRRVFEVPILKSRAPDCSAKEAELGKARLSQLLSIARSFVLRREATILKNYLPPKCEYVVFVTPTPLQLAIFSKILKPDNLDNLMQSSTAESLALINVLTKISNSPILLQATADKAKIEGNERMLKGGVGEALKLLPTQTRIDDFSLSGKLTALSNLLKAIYHQTDEKCILVSHYTSTLNILEAFCKKESYTYYRLDGQTPAAKRQGFVNGFNKSSQHSRFIFLLSSKAGGVGLNLIGASRLCLIDSDWNPSHDLQSMARIHRDGQKRPVYIYRFLTAGTIDEKIYQRQVTKLGLANSLMGSGSSGTKLDSFSRKDLRDIFRIHLNTACHTHDLLECSCGTPIDNPPELPNTPSDESDAYEEPKRGFIVASHIKSEDLSELDRAYLKKKKAELAALGEWTHINCLCATLEYDIQDEILRKLVHSRNNRAVGDKSRIDALLSAVDLDSLTTPDDLSEVPGGTISFLFEKIANSAIDSDDKPGTKNRTDDE